MLQIKPAMSQTAVWLLPGYLEWASYREGRSLTSQEGCRESLGLCWAEPRNADASSNQTVHRHPQMMPSDLQYWTCEEWGPLLWMSSSLFPTPESLFTPALTQLAKGNQTCYCLKPGTQSSHLSIAALCWLPVSLWWHLTKWSNLSLYSEQVLPGKK